MARSRVLRTIFAVYLNRFNHMRALLLTFIALGFMGLVLWPANPSAQSQYPGFSDPGSKAGGGSANGGLAPVAPAVDGGIIPIGATSQVVVRFRNDGSQPVQTGQIRLYPSSNVTSSVALDQCAEIPLASGAECAIAISVKGLQAGAWRVEMLMSHNGRTRLVTATLSGNVEASAEGADKLSGDIETIPDSLDFATLSDSQTLVQPVILRNITSNPIDIKDIFIDTSEQAGYALKTECKRLEAGQACIASVSWSPKLKGRSSGVLVIKHDGPTALASVPLKGEYAPGEVAQANLFPQAVPGKGLLVSSQTLVDFGASVQTASTITVSLVNAGDAAMTLSDIEISGSDNGLSFKKDGCKAGSVLQPIEACPLTITWSPTRIGNLFDDVKISHNGARGVLVLPIRGNASATVSQDQKAIVLNDVKSGAEVEKIIAPKNGQDKQDKKEPPPLPAEANGGAATYTGDTLPGAINAASVLDGYKITSFSPTRAIINGPGGSRIVFHNEEIVLGGVAWYVVIQKNGIEFLHNGQRILLLFDRSLSSINRLQSSSGGGGSSSSASSGAAGESTSLPAAPAAAGATPPNG